MSKTPTIHSLNLKRRKGVDISDIKRNAPKLWEALKDPQKIRKLNLLLLIGSSRGGITISSRSMGLMSPKFMPQLDMYCDCGAVEELIECVTCKEKVCENCVTDFHRRCQLEWFKLEDPEFESKKYLVEELKSYENDVIIY